MTFDGKDPVSVATAFYNALADGDREAFSATLKDFARRQFKNTRGSSAEFWWDSGRRYATEYGIRWFFVEVAENDGKHAKLFFSRRKSDGTEHGRPVPIHLVVEQGNWVVDVATP